MFDTDTTDMPRWPLSIKVTPLPNSVKPTNTRRLRPTPQTCHTHLYPQAPSHVLHEWRTARGPSPGGSGFHRWPASSCSGAWCRAGGCWAGPHWSPSHRTWCTQTRCSLPYAHTHTASYCSTPSSFPHTCTHKKRAHLNAKELFAFDTNLTRASQWSKLPTDRSLLAFNTKEPTAKRKGATSRLQHKRACSPHLRCTGDQGQQNGTKSPSSSALTAFNTKLTSPPPHLCSPSTQTSWLWREKKSPLTQAHLTLSDKKESSSPSKRNPAHLQHKGVQWTKQTSFTFTRGSQWIDLIHLHQRSSVNKTDLIHLHHRGAQWTNLFHLHQRSSVNTTDLIHLHQRSSVNKMDLIHLHQRNSMKKVDPIHLHQRSSVNKMDLTHLHQRHSSSPEMLSEQKGPHSPSPYRSRAHQQQKRANLSQKIYDLQQKSRHSTQRSSHSAESSSCTKWVQSYSSLYCSFRSLFFF